MSSTRSAKPVLGLLVLICLGLAVALALVLRQGPLDARDMAVALRDPDLRRTVVAELVQQGVGVFDAHPDPTVGRVLQPGLRNRQYRRIPLDSNEYGMRERSYALPKPEGTIRVILLGDSFVMGNGVHEEERFGVALEERLRPAADAQGRPLECLHLGVGSWNILGECAWLGRQLELLRPDLVVQVVVSNDLDDNPGVRGYGGRSLFSPQHRERANGMVWLAYPRLLRLETTNVLLHALDHESRTRYAEAAAAIGRLAREVEDYGGRYLLLSNWGRLQAVALERLATELRPEQVAPLARAFGREPENRIAPTDGHWSPLGQRKVAGLLYTIVRDRELLPMLSLPASPEEEAERALLEAGEAEAALPVSSSLDPPLASSIEIAALDETLARQVYGGLYRDGGVEPYASLVLRRGDGRRLRLVGRVPDPPSLEGARLTIHVEEERLGEIELTPGGALDVELPLPDSLLDREHLNVRLLSSDFGYGHETQRRMLCLILERVAVEP